MMSSRVRSMSVLLAVGLLGAGCSASTEPGMTTLSTDVDRIHGPETVVVTARNIKVYDAQHHELFDLNKNRYWDPITDVVAGPEGLVVTAQWRVGALVDRPYRFTIGSYAAGDPITVNSDDRPSVGIVLAYDDTDALTVTSSDYPDEIQPGDVVTASEVGKIVNSKIYDTVSIEVLRNRRRVLVSEPVAIGGPVGRVPSFGWTLATGKDGVQVLGVAPKSPAARAGIRVGDRILTLDGAPVTVVRDIARIASAAMGGPLSIAFVHPKKGDAHVATLRLIEGFYYPDTQGLLSL